MDKKEKFLFKEMIQIINEFNIPWVIRGNILTLLGEQEFVEFKIGEDMSGNFKEYEQLATELINNHAGFLPGQERERILHCQFALAEVFDSGYNRSTADSNLNKAEVTQ